MLVTLEDLRLTAESGDGAVPPARDLPNNGPLR